MLFFVLVSLLFLCLKERGAPTNVHTQQKTTTITSEYKPSIVPHAANCCRCKSPTWASGKRALIQNLHFSLGKIILACPPGNLATTPTYASDRTYTHTRRNTNTAYAHLCLCVPNNAVLVYAIINSCEPHARPRQCVHAVGLLFAQVVYMRLCVIDGFRIGHMCRRARFWKLYSYICMWVCECVEISMGQIQKNTDNMSNRMDNRNVLYWNSTYTYKTTRK